MSTYDFTSILDRRGKDACAVDGLTTKRWGIEPDPPKAGFDFIPMWVADMNFPTCPGVTDAIIKRAQHPAFGYYNPSDTYFDAIIAWRQGSEYDSQQAQDSGFLTAQKQAAEIVTGSAQADGVRACKEQTDGVRTGQAQNDRPVQNAEFCPHAHLRREHIGYENGVHGFLTSAVRVLTEPGESILLHSPNYVGFRSDTTSQGRRCVFSPLRLDENNVWRMDLEDMARRIEENKIRLMIFCSPQNPSGRVWERAELEALMELMEAYHMTVISDEIWADLVFSGHTHIPLQDISPYAREHVLAAYAPSKTFNIAGLIGSYHIIYNDELQERVTREGSLTNYNEMNVLSMHALIGGYSAQGREWLGELNRTLEGNAGFAEAYIREHFPGVSAAMPQGTYMMWLDLKEYLDRSGRTLDEVLHAGWDVGVGWQDGRQFEGPANIRLNLASPRSRIEEAFGRMKRYIFC